MRHRLGFLIPISMLLALLGGERIGARDDSSGRGAAAMAIRSARLRAALRAQPEAAGLWRELGRVERKRCALELAAQAYQRVLERDPFAAEARAGLAEVRLLEGRPRAALTEAETGLSVPQGRACASLWRMKALALLDLKDVERAHPAAAQAARLDPADARILETLARTEYRSGDISAARETYELALRLDPYSEEANLRLGSGFGGPTKGEPWDDAGLAPLWRRAAVAWAARDFEAARVIFARLAELRPDVYKFRLGLGLVARSQRRAEEVRFGRGAESIYARLPAPEPEGIRELVPQYDELGGLARHAVCVAVSPARKWLGALRQSGATHEILSLDDSIADAPRRRSLKGKRSFDGRDYEHLRGVGGRNAATGAEKLAEAAEFGFHTFAHEFAHQLLSFALPAEQVEAVKRLYAAARASGACLDWYAASNPHEYFAQGYEAFVSHAKRGCLKDTRRHTRAELARRDPALLDFLHAQLDVSYESDGEMDAFWSALR